MIYGVRDISTTSIAAYDIWCEGIYLSTHYQYMIYGMRGYTCHPYQYYDIWSMRSMGTALHPSPLS